MVQKDQIYNMQQMKHRVSRYQNNLRNSIPLDTIIQETSLKCESIKQQVTNQMQQNRYKVLQNILCDTHNHLQCCPIEVLVSIVQQAQKNEINFQYETIAIMEGITQADIFKMLFQCIECQKCRKSFIFNLVHKYHILLKLTLWYRRRQLSSLQDYKWFFKLNEVLLRIEANQISSIDALWNTAIRKLLKEQEQNIKFKNKVQIESKVEGQANMSIWYERQNLENIDKLIKSQLRIYQMCIQLLKLYSSQNKKNMTTFYDKYIRQSDVNFLLIVGKLINCTYGGGRTKDGTEQQFQFQIIQPLVKKIQNSNSGFRFQFKIESPKQKEPISEKTIQNNTNNSQSPKKWKINKTESKLISLQQVESIDKNIDKVEKNKNTQAIKLETTEQLFLFLSKLLENKQQQKQQIIGSLKGLKIKNLKGDRKKKKQLTSMLLSASSNQFTLIGSAFENALIYFDPSQLPKTLKECYRNSSREIKDEYEKQRRKRRSELKSLYELFKIQ